MIKEIPSNYAERFRFRIFTGSSEEIHYFSFELWKGSSEFSAKNSKVVYHENGTNRQHLLKKFDLSSNDSFEAEASSEKGEINAIKTKDYMIFSSKKVILK